MNREYIRNRRAVDIDLLNAEEYLPYSEFEIGEEIKDCFADDFGNELDEFGIYAFNYVLSICILMKKYFNNFEMPLYLAAECLQQKMQPVQFLGKKNLSFLSNCWMYLKFSL